MNVKIIERKPDVHSVPPITCATHYTCESQLDIAPGESYASTWAGAASAPPGAAWRTDATGQRRCPPCVRDRLPAETLYVTDPAAWPAAVLPPGLYVNEIGGALPYVPGTASALSAAVAFSGAVFAESAPPAAEPETGGEAADPGAEDVPDPDPGDQDVPDECEGAPVPEADDPALDQVPGPVDVMASFVPMQDRTEDAPAGDEVHRFTPDGTAVIDLGAAETDVVEAVTDGGEER